MNRRLRYLSGAGLGVLATAMVGASLAWACTGPGFGTPSSPAPPDPPAPPGSGSAASAPAPAADPAPSGSSGANSVSGAEPSSGSGEQTNGVERSNGSEGSERSAAPTPSPSPPAPAVGGGSAAPTPSDIAAREIAARESGATEGLTSNRGQPVFASSTAPKPKKKAAAAAPSERSVVGDPWSGFASGSASRGSSAQTSLPAGQGGSTLAMDALGLGFAGVLLATLMVALPRRRPARTGSGGETDSR